MATIYDGDAPRVTPSGEQITELFFFPIEDCEILDTWYSTGLRGTGSHHFQTENLFVPEGRRFAQRTAVATHEGTLYRSPLVTLLTGPLAAVGLGIARHAIESFVKLALEKTPAMGTSTLAERQTTHLRLGQAHALVATGRAFLHNTARELFAALEAGGVAMTDPIVADYRLAGAVAAQNAVQAVDLVWTAAGSSSVYEGSQIERCTRDVRMVTQHVGVAPHWFEAAGLILLGLAGRPAR
jgi:alkylation response protein AidB-like acyl-CoA dehydrogenase